MSLFKVSTVFKRYKVLFICWVVFYSTQAVAVEYTATFTLEETWQAKSSRLQCELTQAIENYGEVFFSIKPEEVLQFGLYHKNSTLTPVSKGNLSVLPGPWMHEYPSLHNYPLYIDRRKKSKYFSIFEKNAENLAVALLAKQFPVFTYAQLDGTGKEEYVKVISSAIKFSSSYEDFLLCREKLIPYALKSFQDKVFYYPEGSSSVLKGAQSALDKIAFYLTVLPKSKLVLVSETSTTGKVDGKLYNRRAQSVIEYLKQKGVKKSRISVKPSFFVPNIKTQVNTIRSHIFGPDVLKTYKYAEGRFYLTKEAKLRLNLAAKYMLVQKKPLIINAHSDRKASRKNYKRLSQQRGDVVKKYLLAQGLAPEKIIVRAYGTSRPLATNRTREGRAMNRRIILSFPF